MIRSGDVFGDVLLWEVDVLLLRIDVLSFWHQFINNYAKLKVSISCI